MTSLMSLVKGLWKRSFRSLHGVCVCKAEKEAQQDTWFRTKFTVRKKLWVWAENKGKNIHFNLSVSSVVPDLPTTKKPKKTWRLLWKCVLLAKQLVPLSRGGGSSQGMLARQRAVPGFNFSCPPGLGHGSWRAVIICSGEVLTAGPKAESKPQLFRAL